MELINFIFYLGINYIIFSIIWFFIVKLPFSLFRLPLSKQVTNYILKTLQYLLIAVITSSATLEFIEKDSELAPFFITIGGFVLFIYLASKLEKNKLFFQINSLLRQKAPTGILKYEPHLIGVVLVLYSISFELIFLSQNPLVFWFKHNINAIYNAPVIGGLISFCGVLFLFTMLSKGIQSIRKYTHHLISILTGKPIQKNQPNNFMDNIKNMKESMENQVSSEIDDVYVDFEEVEEDNNEKKEE